MPKNPKKTKELLSKVDALSKKKDSILGRRVSNSDEIKAISEQVVNDARDFVENQASTRAIKMLAGEIDKMQADPRLRRMRESLQKAMADTDSKIYSLYEVLSKSVEQVVGEVSAAEERGSLLTTARIQGVLAQVEQMRNEFLDEVVALDTQRALLEGEVSRINQELSSVSKSMDTAVGDVTVLIEGTAKETQTAKNDTLALSKKIDDLEKLLSSRIARIVSSNKGGGNMNRNIAVGGNQSVLSRYTDINFIPGSNLTIAYASNRNSGFTDITLSASGGGATPAGDTGQIQYNDGGSLGASSTFSWDANASVLTVGTFDLPAGNGTAGQYLLTNADGSTQWASVTAAGGSGIQRITSIITATTSPGATANRDYMFFAAAGVRVHLPSVASNTNLYTVKNMTASSVLVTAGEGIDDGANALISVQYESLSFLSDGSIWGVV